MAFEDSDCFVALPILGMQGCGVGVKLGIDQVGGPER